jgi:hypothetical protein
MIAWAEIDNEGKILRTGVCSFAKFELRKQTENIVELASHVSPFSGHKYINGEWVNES